MITDFVLFTLAIKCLFQFKKFLFLTKQFNFICISQCELETLNETGIGCWPGFRTPFNPSSIRSWLSLSVSFLFLMNKLEHLLVVRLLLRSPSVHLSWNSGCAAQV